MKESSQFFYSSIKNLTREYRQETKSICEMMLNRDHITNQKISLYNNDYSTKTIDEELLQIILKSQ